MKATPTVPGDWSDQDEREVTQVANVVQDSDLVEVVQITPFPSQANTPMVQNKFRDKEGRICLPRAELARFRELAARVELTALKRQIASERWEAFLATNHDAKTLKGILVDAKAACVQVEMECAEFRALVATATGVDMNGGTCTVDDVSGLIMVTEEA